MNNIPFDTISDVYAGKDLSDWVNEPTATAKVHAVKPIGPSLEDVLDDAEALNDEIQHWKDVALGVQQKRVEVERRLEQAVVVLKKIVEWRSGFHTYKLGEITDHAKILLESFK